MKCSHRTRFSSNPFATRYVAPGALPWIPPLQQSLPELAIRFQQELGRRAAIIGPHGSGKSTLLTQLVPLLGELRWRQFAAAEPLQATARSTLQIASAGSFSENPAGENSVGGGIVWLVLRRSQQSPLPHILHSRSHWRPGGLLVLDGMEQLRSWEYAALRLCLGPAGMGLLATCHHVYRTLPCLVDTSATPQILQQLIAERLAAGRPVSPELHKHLTDLQLIRRMLAEEQGSVREVFMRLYDVVENHHQQRPGSGWLDG